MKPRGLRWEPRYDTGLAEVDRQHRGLVEIVNRLVAALGTEEETRTVCWCLAELVGYASRHFECEEALMAEHDVGFTHESEHAREHRRFTGFVLEMVGHLGERPDTAIEIAHFLIAWLTHHILHTDQEMAALIRAAKLAREPAREPAFVVVR